MKDVMKLEYIFKRMVMPEDKIQIKLLKLFFFKDPCFYIIFCFFNERCNETWIYLQTNGYARRQNSNKAFEIVLCKGTMFLYYFFAFLNEFLRKLYNQRQLPVAVSIFEHQLVKQSIFFFFLPLEKLKHNLKNLF